MDKRPISNPNGSLTFQFASLAHSFLQRTAVARESEGDQTQDESSFNSPLDVARGNVNERSSFTLIELLIVIAIIGILASALVLVLNPAQLLSQSRDSRRTQDLS
ncbi:MAG: type II secretion system protein, partial [Patescibacteria group bacterium]|nr:type II secretion system protein [Patescibacteria group bacterium]